MRIIPHFSAEGLSNVYLVSDNQNHGIIIDPANVDSILLEMIESVCGRLDAVLITHKHQAHTAGLGTMMKIYSSRVYAYEDEICGYSTERVRDGSVFSVGDLRIEVIHVPGHSIDSVVYRIGGAIFTGDTLSSGSIGSTHSFVERALLIRGIESRLMTLDGNTLIYPGHGPLSKIGIERMLNQDLLQFESENSAGRSNLR